MAARSGFTPLTPERQEEFLSRHIPYRLHALDLGVMVSDYRFRRIDSSQPTAIQIGPLSIKAVSGRLFTNAAVEHAMMSCRAMMECLGLKETHLKLADDRGQHPNTVTLEHFGLSPLTADEAIAYLNDPRQVDGLIQTFHSATLAGAHLTMVQADLSPELLAAGCRGTRALVNHFLYAELGRPAPGMQWVEPPA